MEQCPVQEMLQQLLELLFLLIYKQKTKILFLIGIFIITNLTNALAYKVNSMIVLSNS